MNQAKRKEAIRARARLYSVGNISKRRVLEAAEVSRKQLRAQSKEDRKPKELCTA